MLISKEEINRHIYHNINIRNTTEKIKGFETD